VCIFNAGRGSDCVSNVGDRYQLKPASIRWFVNIANGATPWTSALANPYFLTRLRNAAIG
jgi:hypothetical protein